MLAVPIETADTPTKIATWSFISVEENVDLFCHKQLERLGFVFGYLVVRIVSVGKMLGDAFGL